MCPAPTLPPPEGISIKCRIRRSPRSIDPTFDTCNECIVSFSSKCLQITPSASGYHSQLSGGSGSYSNHSNGGGGHTRKRSFIPPPMPRSDSSGRRSDSVGRSGNFSVVDALGMEREEEGEWVGGAKRGSPPRGGEGRVRESDGLPPITPFKRDNSPFLREGSSDANKSTSRSQSRSQSRSRSRSRVRGTLRKRSIGAHAAFSVDTSLDLDKSSHSKSRSTTPMRQRISGSDEDLEPPLEPLTLPLKDVVSVDQEIPSRNKRTSSAGSDFFSSLASETGSSTLMSPPKPSDSYHGKTPHRIFLHTSTNGYIEFSFDNPNSHDVLMAFLKAHLKPNQLPRKTPNNQSLPPAEGALRTMILTPSKLDRSMSIPPPPRLTRSTSTDSTCTLEKLQKKMIQNHIQSETTPMERMKENLASWMSSIVDCACCQDTTSEGNANEAVKRGIVESPASKELKRKGIGGLSFEENIIMSKLSPRLSFEKSVATDDPSGVGR